MPTSPRGHGLPKSPAWPSADDAAAARIDDFDWSSTSVGAREEWSGSLMGCVRIMLSAATPVALVWGEDLTIIPNGAWTGRLGGPDPIGRSAILETSRPWPTLRTYLDNALRNGRIATVNGHDAAARRFRVIPMSGETGRTAGLWIDGETAAGPRSGWLPLALEAGRLAVLDWNIASGTMAWSDQFHRLLGFEPGAVEPSHELLRAHVQPEDLAELDRAMEIASSRGERLDCAFRVVRPDGSTRWCEARGHAVQDVARRNTRLMAIVDDVTELTLARTRQRKLQHDLLHRVRNILFIVRSIVKRSAETASDTDELAEHLEARVDTLARLQSNLLLSPDGVGLQILILEELRKAAASENHVQLDGPEITLPPRVAQTVCLAIHELITNATTFGALSETGGRLDVAWSIRDEELRLFWTERGIPIPAPPEHRGFGLSLLQDVLPYELGARVETSFTPEGFQCSIDLPLKPD